MTELKIFSIVLHPDTSGMAHIIGMIERFLKWLFAFGDNVECMLCEQIAEHCSNTEERWKAAFCKHDFTYDKLYIYWTSGTNGVVIHCDASW